MFVLSSASYWIGIHLLCFITLFIIWIFILAQSIWTTKTLNSPRAVGLGCWWQRPVDGYPSRHLAVLPAVHQTWVTGTAPSAGRTCLEEQQRAAQQPGQLHQQVLRHFYQRYTRLTSFSLVVWIRLGFIYIQEVPCSYVPLSKALYPHCQVPQGPRFTTFYD